MMVVENHAKMVQKAPAIQANQVRQTKAFVNQAPEPVYPKNGAHARAKSNPQQRYVTAKTIIVMAKSTKAFNVPVRQLVVGEMRYAAMEIGPAVQHKNPPKRSAMGKTMTVMAKSTKKIVRANKAKLALATQALPIHKIRVSVKQEPNFAQTANGLPLVLVKSNPNLNNAETI